MTGVDIIANDPRRDAADWRTHGDSSAIDDCPPSATGDAFPHGATLIIDDRSDPGSWAAALADLAQLNPTPTHEEESS